MSDLSTRIAALTPEKLALVWERLRHRGNDSADHSITRIHRTEPCPASFAQQRLWFLNQLEPDSPFYNIASLVRIVGPLNRAALEQSVSEMIRRHEGLRTTFSAADGQPVQVIAPHRRWQLPMTDLRALATPVRQTEAERAIRNQARQKFDLTLGPLLRALLLQIAEREYLFILTVHHIVSDEWSSGVAFRELASLYRAFSAGMPHPLPELSIQYSDFVRWQRTRLQGDVLERQLQYWKTRLAGSVVTELPTDRPRPPLQTFRGATQTFGLSRTLTESVEALSRQESATLFITLLAAFQTHLHRHTGQCDISVGVPIANRNRKELEELIGVFVNTLVLRSDLSGDPSFRQLLRRVQQIALDAYSHQDVPFETVVDALRPERVLSHSPLFQVMFALRNASPPSPAFGGLTMTPVDAANGTSQFDLSLLMTKAGKELTGCFDYNVDLFDGVTIARMREHWMTLLEGIVATPDRALSDLPVQTRSECHQLLVEWNDTQAEYAPIGRLHEAFEAQAERTPDAVAVAFENDQWTYRTLNRRANQLAHHLRALVGSPAAPVAVYMEPSFEMTAALLGILKAGAAYLPLDPRSPKARLHSMLEDARVELIVTQQSLLAGLPEDTARRICVDADRELISRASDQNPVCRFSPEQPAYVIYTSGSTGQPKGVVIAHAGICNRLGWMQQVYRLVETDHVLQKTPANFDVSIWEFFWPLSNGARLVLSRPEGYQDSDYLARVIAEQEITRIHFVPAMLEVFLNEPGVERCGYLRQVICSGEALSLDLQRRFFDWFAADLDNLYGPTEASIDVCAWTCRRDSRHSAVPIGRPIANMQVYILDSRLRPVPIGVSGELHLAGVGLSDGYLNRPDLTARTFVPNPFGTPGTRLYKTGDAGRYLADGNIDFRGRTDSQIKIRGFRIEPGEVEARLREHPSVKGCTIVARTDVTRAPLLVAYVVANEPRPPSPTELRTFLTGRLPDYMVPSAFVMLDALPLTRTGKIDYDLLPVPDRSRSAPDAGFVLPRSPAESCLATIWCDVLCLEEVGVHDNFFELGGHSISSIQIVARARRVGLRLTPKDIFQHPTIAALAAIAAPLSDGHESEADVTSPVLTASAPSAAPATYTPSDFPKARLTRKDLDRVIARVRQAEGASLR